MSNGKSKSKGARGERELAKELARLFNVEAHRGRQYHGGPGTPDVVADIPGVHFEVKRVEALSLYPALEQAAADAGEDVPVVAHRRNNRQWVAVCYLDDLPRLAAQIYLVMAENV